jgi:hypothetical protein
MVNSDWILADFHMNGYPFPDTEVAVYWARDGLLPNLSDLARAIGSSPTFP